MADPEKANETTKESKPTLVIDLSEEYKIKIEEPDKLKGSFFEEIYLKAADAVADIIEQTDRNKKTDKNDPFLNEKQDYNNIIAFCGERGTGKSSAMISFAQSLLKLNESKGFYTDKNLISRNFHTIKIIDPSLFEKHENIFEVILAQLFSSFEKELNKKEKESDLNVKRELLEQFEKVYENLQTIRKDGQKYDGEALETLNKLACGANLRQNFKELVKLYLNFIVDKENRDSAYLIIPIDDFDLNVNAAAEMAEQIRKYLMIPRVIVLMAVKIEQLADAKEQQVRKDFEVLINSKTLNEDPRIITSQYVLKLIPNNRRIEMPNLNSALTDSRFQLKNKIETVNYENVFIGFQTNFFFKTSAIIGLKEFFNIELFPRTLRELKDFFIAFENSKTKDQIVDYLINKFNEKQNSKTKLLNKILLLPNNEKNLFVIRAIIDDIVIQTNNLQNEILDKFEDISDECLEIKEIIEKETMPYNITLGDLLLFFKVIEESEFHHIYKNLIDTIKLLYTIWLSNFFEAKEYERILELTNGGVYNPGYKEVLRGKRSRFQINGSILSNKPDPNNIKLLSWLIYFIEYPQYSSYRRNTIPYYQKTIDIGSGRFLSPIFNVLNIFISTLLPQLQAARSNQEMEIDEKVRNRESSVNFEISVWLNNYKGAFPIFNIFILEQMLWIIDTDYKEKATFPDLVYFLFSQIQKFLNQLEFSEPLFRRYEIEDAFRKCPVIAPILEGDKEYVAFLNNIPREQDSSFPSLLRKIQESTRRNIYRLKEDIERWSKPILGKDDYEILVNKMKEFLKNIEKPKVLKEKVLVYLEEIRTNYE